MSIFNTYLFFRIQLLKTNLNTLPKPKYKMTISHQQVLEILSHPPYPTFEPFGDSNISLNETLDDDEVSTSFETILNDFELTEEQKQRTRSMSIDERRNYYNTVVNEDKLTPSPRHMRQCLLQKSDPRLLKALHSQFRKNRISYRREFLEDGGFELLTNSLEQYSQNQETLADVIGCFHNILASNELCSQYFANESQKHLFSVMINTIINSSSNSNNIKVKQVEEENRKLKEYAKKLKNASHISSSKRFEQKAITDQLKKDKAEIERLRYELELLRNGQKPEFNGPTQFEFDLLKQRYDTEVEKTQMMNEQMIRLRRKLDATTQENQDLRNDYSAK